MTEKKERVLGSTSVSRSDGESKKGKGMSWHL